MNTINRVLSDAGISPDTVHKLLITSMSGLPKRKRKIDQLKQEIEVIHAERMILMMGFEKMEGRQIPKSVGKRELRPHTDYTKIS